MAKSKFENESKFGVYTGTELFQLELPRRKWIIKNILRERDSVVLVGGEKSGKSILVQQLMCSLTSGEHSFLDEYEVYKACKVTYVQLEGELSDTKDRLLRMTKNIDFDPSNFQIVFSEPLNLRDNDQAMQLCEKIANQHIPDVLIIDPLYFAVSGKLADDEIIREFLGNIRQIKEFFGCAVILIHHTHKVKFDLKGKAVKEGDEAIFGSGALKWWPDHIILFIRDPKTELRYFSCVTQRGGDIVKNLTLRLVEPDPLYFEKIDNQNICESKTSSIYKLLEFENAGLPAKDIMKKLEMSRATFYFAVGQLISEKLVIKSGLDKRPVLYRIV